MTRHLLAISIGPVQDFIAAARKTRDLWYGSWLLSTVARASASALRDQHAELIFPHDTAVDDPDAAVANKLLAILQSGTDPASAATTAKAAARARLRQELETALQTRSLDDRLVDLALTRDHVDSFLEIQSAWVPLAADDHDYPQQRARLERLLAGRKALRDFTQPPSRPGLVKSSLDPSHDSVVNEWVYDGERSSRAAEAAAARRQLGLTHGERLDGISLVKRLAPTSQPATARRFVSVSRVAADPWVRRAAEAEGARLLVLADLANKLMPSGAVEPLPTDPRSELAQYAAFPYDLELFYDDGRTDERLSTEAHTGLARTFHEQVRRFNLGEVPAYYAVLVADGDHMGRLIAQAATPGAHRDLSQRLVEFARQAGEIVAKHLGALVYAGGDDVMALLPLDRALACADALRRAFPATVDASVTLSVGMAIAHYNEPLSEVLGWARAVEQHAKAHGWRNSLAVAFYARSGGGTATTVLHHWTDDPVAAHWNEWIRWHHTGALPDGTAYELRALLSELRFLPQAQLATVLPLEVRRILGRKRVAGTQPVADAIVNAIVAPSSSSQAPEIEPADRLARLVDGLIVARRIAAATPRPADVLGSQP